MNGESNCQDILSIFLITYNRASSLGETLKCLSQSAFANFKICILNNASTDNTIDIIEKNKNNFSNLSYISHLNNIGANANVMRAFELSIAKYTWILCDDDKINAVDIEDFLQVLKDGEVDLIHVGAHTDIKWDCAGKKMSAKELIKNGYHYFKASSFLPCNVFKTEVIQKNFLVPGYNNIANSYPHMPFMCECYKSDKLVYLTKKRLVTAVSGNQSYDMEKWFFWWLNSSRILKDFFEVRAFFFDHFIDESLEKDNAVFSFMQSLYVANVSYRYIILGFVEEFFTSEEQKIFKNGIRKRLGNSYLSIGKLTSFGRRILKKF